MLTMPAMPVFSYFSDPVLRHRQGQGFVWSISGITVTHLTLFRFLGACCKGSVGFTCHNDDMCHTGGSFWLLFPPKVRERVEEIELSWFPEESSFDPIHSVFAVRKSAQVDWTCLCSLDTCFSCLWGPGEVIELSEGHKTVLRRHPLHGMFQLQIVFTSPHAVCFAVDWLRLNDEAGVRLFRAHGALSSASDAMGGDSHDNGPNPYPDDEYGDD